MTIVNYYGLNASQYVPPDINKWLSNMGLGGLISIENYVRIHVIGGQYPPIPVPIAPVFFTSLRSAGSFSVNEMVREVFFGEPGEFNRPLVSRLTALPGLASLRQLYLPSQGLGRSSLNVSGTAFTDLRSFASLTCAPTIMNLINNTLLTTMDGLQQLATPTSTNQSFSAIASGPFMTAASLAPLRGFAACNGGTAGAVIGTNVSIPVGCNTLLTTWDQVCAYNGTPVVCPPI